MVNNPALTVDCSYYKSAFEWTAGIVTDTLGGGLNLLVSGSVTIPGDNNGIVVDNTDLVILEDFFPTEDYLASVQVVFTGEIVGNSGDGDSVVILTQASDIRAFNRSGTTLDHGGNLFNGHSNTGDVWVFSASFMDNNYVDNNVKERLVDFELLKVGDSLTSHGRTHRYEEYTALVASSPTDLKITGIDGVILEVHYQDFIMDPEDI